jgi:phosphoserine phosphatase RsbU/P
VETQEPAPGADLVRSRPRLDDVHATGLLDTGPEESFDRFARLAAMMITDVTVFVTLVDERRSFWKAAVAVPGPGPDVRQNTVEQSFCRYVIQRDGELVVDDARTDPLTRANPSVAEMGVAAWAGFPIRSRHGRVLGTFCAVATEPRAWDETELAVLETLSHAVAAEMSLRTMLRAAQGAEQAAVRESSRARALAAALQHSLLPRALPDVPRLSLAAHYRPAGRHTKAGGDWYDVIRLGEDRVGIAVGDVVGHGATAAAIMGQLRSALNAYLAEGHPPSRALELLSAVARHTDGALASTAVCLTLDTRTGELRWSSAGHAPPMLVDPAGDARPARQLPGAVGAVLGATRPVPGRVAHPQHAARLPVGASVLLHTDGLIERAGERLDAGWARLAEAAARAAARPPQDLLDEVLGSVLPGSGPTDDVAIVVARLLPAPAARPAAAPDPAPQAPPAGLDVVRHRSGALTIRLTGEVDMSTAGPLRSYLLDRLAGAAAPVSVDTSGVTYLGSAGIQLIVEAVRVAGPRLHLHIEPGSVVERALEVTGLLPDLRGATGDGPPD